MSRRFGAVWLVGVLSMVMFAGTPAQATSGLVYARASNWVYRMEITAATVNDVVGAGIGTSHVYTLDATYEAQIDLACVTVEEAGRIVTVRAAGISSDGGHMFHLFMQGSMDTHKGSFAYEELAPDPGALACTGWQLPLDEATDVNVEWIASS